MFEALLTIFYTLLFVRVIRKWNFFTSTGVNVNLLSGVFLLKIAFGFLLFAIYYFWYGNNRFTSDAFRFYDDSLVIYNSLNTNPTHFFRYLFGIGLDDPKLYDEINTMNFWTKEYNHGLFNDNQTIIRFNAVFDVFSFGNYHVHTVFMCFLSFIGLTGLYKAFSPYFTHLKGLLFLVIYLIPSVLFWGSGVLKEGIILFSMGLFIWSLFKLSESLSWKIFILFIATFFLMMFIKIYVVIALLPSVTGWLISTKTKVKSFLVFPFIGSLGVIGVLLTHNNIPEIDILTKLFLKQNDFINMIEASGAGSGFELKRLTNENLSFLKATPTALINSLFRPFLWEVNSPLMLVNSIENCLFFAFGLFCLIWKKNNKEINWNLVWFCGVYLFFLYLFIGWVTPVSGAIVRYKVPGWSFFMIFFLLFLDTEKLHNKLPFLNKLNGFISITTKELRNLVI